MLKRLYADNFRALVNFEFKPGRLNLLLGDNGSGKTSVFEVLGSIKNLLVLGRPAAELFLFTRTRWDARELQRFEIDFDNEGGTFRYTLEIEHPPDLPERPFIRSEAVSLEGAPLFRYSGGEVQLFESDQTPGPIFPFAGERSFLQNIDVQSRRKLPRLFQFKTFLANTWIIQPNPFAMEAGSRQEHLHLSRDTSNFPSFFSFLTTERPEARDELEKRLREALPGFRRFAFNRAGDQKFLNTSFENNGQAATLSLKELSEGQRVLASLYAALLGLWTSGTTVCFDEPDNFVSLPEIQPWLHLLRDTVEARGGQAMVISHHPEVMDYLALDSVWYFERTSGPVRVRPYEPEKVPDAEALKLSELVARGM